MEIIENKQLHHLGLIAGMCQEIGIGQIIDTYIAKPKRKVSVGKAVEAMIINALGFTGRAIYLTPKFMKNKPTDVLIGEGITEQDLNENSLGTALDALYKAGLTELFYTIASSALKQFKIKHNFVHLDTTSISLHGKYNSEAPYNDPRVVKITKGLSKDKAPDLNQVIVSLMCTYKSSIPLWIETLSGNSSDKTSFRETIKAYQHNFNKKRLPYFICDSALYTMRNILELTNISWVTRVPETIKEAKAHILKVNKKKMTHFKDGYYYRPVKSAYGGVAQRWIIVFSEKAHEREMETFQKNLKKLTENKQKELWHLCNKGFACEADAVKAVKEFGKKLKYHTVDYSVECRNHYSQKGRPTSKSKPTGSSWYIFGELKENSKAVKDMTQRKGMFIIATNELETTRLTDEQLISVYKAQGISVERGFRFLKDPMFYAESLYLKSPHRIMALIMVMGLSLLVYSLAERKIRKAMKMNDLTIKNQKRKPTQKPTIRWVFQVFEGILYLVVKEGQKKKRMSMNIEDDHRTILKCLGPPYEKIYFL
jgi:transposase